MTDPGSVYSTVGSLGWVGTVIATVLGGAWIAVTYLNGKRIEFQRTFNDRTLEIVFLTAQTVGGLVACKCEKKWEEHKAQFWELYWGRLVLFESDDTRKAMIVLGEELKVMTFAGRWELHSQAYDVSKSLRNYLKDRNQNDWRIAIEDFSRASEPGKP